MARPTVLRRTRLSKRLRVGFRDEALRRWVRGYAWFTFAGVVAVALVLALLGFDEYFRDRDDPRSFSDLLYFSLQLFVFENRATSSAEPATLEVARILAPALSAFGVAAAVGSIVRALKSREFRLARLKDHVIICGLGRKGSLLALGFRDDDAESQVDVVAIESGADPVHIEQCRKAGVLVLTGDATDRGMLAEAALDRARCLVALTGSDGGNAQIALSALELLEEGDHPPIDVFVHVVDPEFRRLLENSKDGKSLHIISAFDTAAAQMLGLDPPFDPSRWPPEGRLLVVGLGDLGKSVVMHATDLWRGVRGKEPLSVLVLDRNADTKIEHLRLRREDLSKHWTLEGWPDDIDGPKFDGGEYLARDRPDVIGGIYVCLDDDPLALKTAQTLANRFAADQVPIVVRMSHDTKGLAKLLPPGVRPFGMLEAACHPSSLLAVETDIRSLSDL
jgi:hypothetical protein